MEPKKNPNADLRKYRNLIFGFSFLITLSFVITAFEWKSYGDGSVVITKPAWDIFDPLLEIKHTVIPPPPKPVQIVTKLVEVKDDEMVLDEPNIDIDPDISLASPPFTLLPPPAPEVEGNNIFDFVEKSAEPIGGLAAFYKHVASKIKYPNQARRMGIEGKVYVQFVINKDGTLTDIKVIKGIGAGCDEEALKVIEAAPPWSPGKQRGVPVRQRMVLPITFKLG